MQFVEQFRSEFGINLNPEWMSMCVEKLEASHVDFQRLSLSQKFELLFKLFLEHDFDKVSLGGNLPPVKDLHGTQLKGRFTLQLNEVVNIAASSKDRYVEKGPTARSLRLGMTDGKQQVTAFEDRPMAQLKVNMPAGIKVQLFDVEVRRGILLLGPENLKILGGQVDELEARRQLVVAKWSEPVRAQRGNRTAADFRSTLVQTAWGPGGAAAPPPLHPAQAPHTQPTATQTPSFAPANTQHHMSPDPLSAHRPLSHPPTQAQSSIRPGMVTSQTQQQLPHSFQPSSTPSRHAGDTHPSVPPHPNQLNASQSAGTGGPVSPAAGAAHHSPHATHAADHTAAAIRAAEHVGVGRTENAGHPQGAHTRPWQHQAQHPPGWQRHASQQIQQQQSPFHQASHAGHDGQPGATDLSPDTRPEQHRQPVNHTNSAHGRGNAGTFGSSSLPGDNNEHMINFSRHNITRATDQGHIHSSRGNPDSSVNHTNHTRDANMTWTGAAADVPSTSVHKKMRTGAASSSLPPWSSSKAGMVDKQAMNMDSNDARSLRTASQQLPSASPTHTHTPHIGAPADAPGSGAAPSRPALHSSLATPHASLSQHGSQLAPSRGMSRLSLSKRVGSHVELSQHNAATSPPSGHPMQSPQADHHTHNPDVSQQPAPAGRLTPPVSSPLPGECVATESGQAPRGGAPGSRSASSNLTHTSISPAHTSEPHAIPTSPRSHSPRIAQLQPTKQEQNDPYDTDDDVVIVRDDDDDDDDEGDYHRSQPVPFRQGPYVAVKMDIDDVVDGEQPAHLHESAQLHHQTRQQQQLTSSANPQAHHASADARGPAPTSVPQAAGDAGESLVSHPSSRQPCRGDTGFGSFIEAADVSHGQSPANNQLSRTHAVLPSCDAAAQNVHVPRAPSHVPSGHHPVAAVDGTPPTLVSLSAFEEQQVPHAHPDDPAQARVIATVMELSEVFYGDEPEAAGHGPGCVVSIVDGGTECPAVIAPCVIEQIAGCSWEMWTGIHSRAEAEQDEQGGAEDDDPALERIDEVEQYLYKFYGIMWIRSEGPGTPVQIVRLETMTREALQATINRQWVLQQSDSSCGVGLGLE